MGFALEVSHPFGRDKQVKRYRLHSGLGVILLVDRAAPIVTYQTWFRVGSRHEMPGKTGIAHLFEHLMFNQTRSLAPGEFDVLIERTGGDNNAATWVDWTFYRDTLPSRDLELAVRLESDRMQNLTLEHEQLESEREVVIHERMQRVEDDLDGFLDEQLMKLAFQVHPYHWPTIGWMDDIRNLSLADIHAFYRTYYAPNNATIVIVGDIDEARVLELLERYYGAIPPSEIPPELAQPEPPQREERRLRFDKPIPAPRLFYGYKAPPQGHPDWAAMDFIGELLAGSPSARMYRRLVIETELATSVDSGVLPFRDPSMFRFEVNLVRGRRPEEIDRELEAAIARLREGDVSAAELEKVKSGIETDFWSQLEHCDGKAEALGHYETTLGDFRELFAMAERLHAVTAEDIARVAAAYLVPERRTVVLAEPSGEDEA
jgi:zinc protease